MGLFWGILSCSTDLCFYFWPVTILFWSLLLCSTVWSQVAWFFQLHFPFSESWNISGYFFIFEENNSVMQVKLGTWNLVPIPVCVWGDLHKHQAIFGYQQGVLSILTLYVEIASDCTDYPSYLTAGRPLPFQTLHCKSRYFWSTGYPSKVPTTSLLGPMHLLEWLTELRQTCRLPDCQFGVKGCDSGRSRMKEMGQGVGKGRRVSVPSPASAAIPSHDIHTTPDMLQTLSSWF